MGGTIRLDVIRDAFGQTNHVVSIEEDCMALGEGDWRYLACRDKPIGLEFPDHLHKCYANGRGLGWHSKLYSFKLYDLECHPPIVVKSIS